MKEITVIHKETITQENGRTVVFNEWLYDNLPIHVAMWFDDHTVKAKNIELTIYDNPLERSDNSPFSNIPGIFTIHSENGYWIDHVTRKEGTTVEQQRLYLPEPEHKEVTSFTLKLDNTAIRNLGITRPVFHEDGRELWKEDIPLLQHIQEKENELTSQASGSTSS